MLDLFSPAKINLFLRVVSKRSDGYHDLSSLFQTITLGDTLSIARQTTHDDFTCTNPELPTDRSNLVLKAIDLFRRKTGLSLFFKVHLHKRIPIQAGLGGGSSNAATTLWGCNQLAKTNIPTDLLKEWSAEIGSDVPFFFSSGSAYCTGRGEHVQSISPLAPCSLWIVKPPHGLSTPEIFRCLNFGSPIPIENWCHDLKNFMSGSLLSFNDLERPAFDKRPELKQLKDKLLKDGFTTVVMTGSGSAFFCLGRANLSHDSELNLSIFSAHFMNRSHTDWYTFLNHKDLSI